MATRAEIVFNRNNTGPVPVAGAPNTLLVIGPSSVGTPNVPQSFTSVSQAQAALGFGPVVTAAGVALATYGASQVFCIPCEASIAGTIYLQSSGSGPSGPAISFTGTPYDRFNLTGQIVNGGDLGTATFQYSLDDNQSTSGEYPTTGSFVVPGTGLTIDFGAGTYVAGTAFTAYTYAPTPQADDILAAANSFTGSNGVKLLGIPVCLGLAFDTTSSVVGQLNDVAGDAAQTTYLGVQLPVVGVFPTGGQVQNVSDIVASQDEWESAPKNFNHVDALRGRTFTAFLGIPGYTNPLLPLAYTTMAAVATQIPCANPAAGNAPLQGFSQPEYDELYQPDVFLQNDIGAPTSSPNSNGTFLNQGNTKAGPDSTFEFIMWGKVYNLAQVTIQKAIQPFLNNNVFLNANGTMTKGQQSYINGVVSAALTAAIIQQPNTAVPGGFVGWASKIQFFVDPNWNVALTNKINCFCNIQPLGNATLIQINLALQLVS